MTIKVLLIGINYIGSRNQLNGCINDISNIYTFLTSTYNIPTECFKILSDKPENKGTELFPTRNNIISAMKWLVEGNTAESRLFKHYSGHGSYTVDTSKTEPSGYNQTICPIDYTSNGFIIDNEIKRLIVEPLVEGAKLTVLFDDCHSGTALDLRYNYKIDLEPELTTFYTYIIKGFEKINGNVILLSGCRDGQTSADAFFDGKSQGAMTYSFLTAYKELSEKKKQITYRNLMKHIYNILKKDGYIQDPQISSGNYMDLNMEFNIL